MRPNTIKQLWRDDKPALGAWLGSASTIVAEQMAHAGFDWLLVDGEHSPVDTLTMVQMLQAISTTDTILTALSGLLEDDPDRPVAELEDGAAPEGEDAGVGLALELPEYLLEARAAEGDHLVDLRLGAFAESARVDPVAAAAEEGPVADLLHRGDCDEVHVAVVPAVVGRVRPRQAAQAGEVPLLARGMAAAPGAAEVA